MKNTVSVPYQYCDSIKHSIDLQLLICLLYCRIVVFDNDQFICTINKNTKYTKIKYLVGVVYNSNFVKYYFTDDVTIQSI